MSSVSQSLDGQGTWLRIPVTVLTLLMWASMILFGGYILARHGARFEHNLATNDLATAIDAFSEVTAIQVSWGSFCIS